MKFAIFWILGLNFGLAVSINWNGNWAFACDFKGNNIGNAQIRGEDCSNKCIATSGCTHFTWTTYNGGTCWMKGGPASKGDAFDTGDQSMVCGVLGITWNGDWANACDFYGGDIGNKAVTSDKCGGACAAYSGCTHFTWTNYNGGTCWLKGGSVSKADAFYNGDMGMVCGVVSSSPGTNARGVFVPWPKRVFGIYILLADEGVSGFTSSSNWSPILYPYQQNGANVLFFSFINPQNMNVPPSYANLAKTRGTGQAGAIPANTVIIFAIGGYGYSLQYNPWPWLESQASAEAMAVKVATWPNLYKCDGIDLDLEEGAGDQPNAGQNMVYFIRKLRQLVPNMIISQPTYGYPKVPAENYVINQSWDANGNNKNLADSIGLMTYEGAASLNYARYYVSGPDNSQAITCRAPSNTILVGASGSISPTDLQTLVNGVNSNNYRGIMVWFASVQNGFSYGADDATKYPQNQQALINAKNNFAAQN